MDKKWNECRAQAGRRAQGASDAGMKRKRDSQPNARHMRMTCLIHIQPLSRRSEGIKGVYTFLALCFPLHMAEDKAAFEWHDERWHRDERQSDPASWRRRRAEIMHDNPILTYTHQHIRLQMHKLTPTMFTQACSRPFPSVPSVSSSNPCLLLLPPPPDPVSACLSVRLSVCLCSPLSPNSVLTGPHLFSCPLILNRLVSHLLFRAKAGLNAGVSQPDLTQNCGIAE